MINTRKEKCVFAKGDKFVILFDGTVFKNILTLPRKDDTTQENTNGTNEMGTLGYTRSEVELSPLFTPFLGYRGCWKVRDGIQLFNLFSCKEK